MLSDDPILLVFCENMEHASLNEIEEEHDYFIENNSNEKLIFVR